MKPQWQHMHPETWGESSKEFQRVFLFGGETLNWSTIRFCGRKF